MLLERVSPRDNPETAEEAVCFVATCGLPTEGLAEHADVLLLVRAGLDRVPGLEPETATVSPVGCVAIEAYGTVGLLRSLAVSEPYRERGVGATLVGEGVETARSMGLHDLYLLTDTAAPFLKRFGFHSVPRSKAPTEIVGSGQFSSACPASAVFMHLRLT